MSYYSIFFYSFSAVLLISAFKVVTSRNPVHAVLYLMLAFSQSAALWLMLKAEFLGVTLVLVYLGAVMVLFLFVVMMMDIRHETTHWKFWKSFPVALTIGLIIAFELIILLNKGIPDQALMIKVDTLMQQNNSISNTKLLGLLLFKEYLYPMQVAAVILLVAMVAAIALTLRTRKDSLYQDPALQVMAKADERIQLIRD